MAPFAPAATMVSKAGPSAPSSIMRASSSRATSRSVTPGPMLPITSASAWSLIAQAVRRSSSSSSSLTARSTSTSGSSGTGPLSSRLLSRLNVATLMLAASIPMPGAASRAATSDASTAATSSPRVFSM